MALKADPPDFVDSGTYRVRDVSGWGMKLVEWTLGAVLVVVALGFGVAFGRQAENSISQATGLETENSSPITQFGGGS